MTRLRRVLDRNRESGAGGESLELVIVAPIILVIFAIVIAAGRFELGQSKIDQAASAAARAASLQLTAGAAQQAAQTAAAQALAEAGVTCQDEQVQTDTTTFTATAAPGAAVAVTVSCTVDWSDLTIPGWPGQKTITSTASSPVDTKRVGT